MRVSTLNASPFVVLALSAQSLVQAANVGSWGPSINFPLVTVAVALRPQTGDLLAWSAYSNNAFLIGKSGMTQTAIYSPKTGKVTAFTVTNTQHDMFCPGISMDFNGRVVVTGGDTAPKTSINTGGDTAWIAGGQMNIGRGYQASATCSDGRIFTIGGSWSGGDTSLKNGEIMDPKSNKWTMLNGALVKPMLTNDAAGAFRSDSHAWLFGWKNGFVFQAGPSKSMNWYGTSGSGSQKFAGTRGNDGDAMNGNAAMYDAVAGKILTVGGAPSYQDDTATSNAHVITIGAPGTTASVQNINSMSFQRSFANSVILPNGQVFITGGQSFAKPFTDTTAIMTPELWDPNTFKFTKMATNPTPRTYHSVGLLMPDGTVFTGGGGLCGSGCKTNHFDAQIYTPPYLLKSDGKTFATRPIIKSGPSVVRVGGKMTITTSYAVPNFALMRMGTNTHAVNTDQRRIPLPASGKGTTYTLTVPSDPGVALPGYWMLFAIDGSGVPSISKTIQITL